MASNEQPPKTPPQEPGFSGDRLSEALGRLYKKPEDAQDDTAASGKEESAPVPDTALAAALSAPKPLKTSKKPRASTRKDRMQEKEITPANAAGTVNEQYRAIAEEVKELGVDPSDLPAKVWARANAAVENARNLSELYEKAATPAAKQDIEARLKKLVISMGGGKIHQEILAEARTQAATKPAKQPEAAVHLPPTPFVPRPEIATAVPQAPKETAGAANKMPSRTGEHTDAVKQELAGTFAKAVDRAYEAMENHPERQVEYFSNIMKLRERENDLAREKLSSTGKAVLARTQAERWDLQAKLDKSIDAEAGEAPRDDLENEFWALGPNASLEQRLDLLARIEERLKEPTGQTPTTLTEYRHEREQERRLEGLAAVRDSLTMSVGEINAREDRSAREEKTYVGSVVPAAEAAPGRVPEEIGKIQPSVPDAEVVAGDTVAPPGPDATPAEQRHWLKTLVLRAKGLGAAGKEKIEWWKSASEGLIRRSAELDAQAEKIGGLEKVFRACGETYNKLGWKSKLAVGLSLGVGAGAALSFGSIALAAPLLFGTAAQRVAGLASVFLKFENSTSKGKYQKERAMGKALLYSVGMTAGTTALISSSEWLFDKLGHVGASSSAPVVPAEPEVMATEPSGPVPVPVESQDYPHTSGDIEPNEVEAPPAPAGETVPIAPEAASPVSEVLTPIENDELGRPIVFDEVGNVVPPPDSVDVTPIETPVETASPSISVDTGIQLPAPVEDGVAVPPLPDAGPMGNVVTDSQGAPVMTEEGPLTYGEPIATQASAPAEDAVMSTPLESASEIETTPLAPQPDVETYPIESPAESIPAETVRPEPDISAFEPSPEPVTSPDAPSMDESGFEPSPAPETVQMLTQVGEPIDAAVPAIYEAKLPSGEVILAAYGGTDDERLALISDFINKPENAGKMVRWAHEMKSVFGPQMIVDDVGDVRESGGIFSTLFKTLGNKSLPAPTLDNFIRKVTP